jgi:hypothetical protein
MLVKEDQYPPPSPLSSFVVVLVVLVVLVADGGGDKLSVHLTDHVEVAKHGAFEADRAQVVTRPEMRRTHDMNNGVNQDQVGDH